MFRVFSMELPKYFLGVCLFAVFLGFVPPSTVNSVHEFEFNQLGISKKQPLIYSADEAKIFGDMFAGAMSGLMDADFVNEMGERAAHHIPGVPFNVLAKMRRGAGEPGTLVPGRGIHGDVPAEPKALADVDMNEPKSASHTAGRPEPSHQNRKDGENDESDKIKNEPSAAVNMNMHYAVDTSGNQNSDELPYELELARDPSSAHHGNSHQSGAKDSSFVHLERSNQNGAIDEHAETVRPRSESALHTGNHYAWDMFIDHNDDKLVYDKKLTGEPPAARHGSGTAELAGAAKAVEPVSINQDRPGVGLQSNKKPPAGKDLQEKTQTPAKQAEEEESKPGYQGSGLFAAEHRNVDESILVQKELKRVMTSNESVEESSNAIGDGKMEKSLKMELCKEKLYIHCPCGLTTVKVPVDMCREKGTTKCKPCLPGVPMSAYCSKYKYCRTCYTDDGTCDHCLGLRIGPFCEQKIGVLEVRKVLTVYEISEPVLQRVKRMSRCHVPMGLNTADIHCTVTEEKTVCQQKCVWGYRIDSGGIHANFTCDMKKGDWTPREPTECKPYVNCDIKFKGASEASRKCTFNLSDCAPTCEIACKGGEKTNHTCGLDGHWFPELPDCVEKDNDLVTAKFFVPDESGDSGGNEDNKDGDKEGSTTEKSE